MLACFDPALAGKFLEGAPDYGIQRGVLAEALQDAGDGGGGLHAAVAEVAERGDGIVLGAALDRKSVV